MTATRTFTGAPAVRASIPLWIGLYGPSGSGKTYSALRLAKGIQSVVGGLIGGGDTENGRMAHYAGEFDFIRYPFEPPFPPAAYLALLRKMVQDGITVGIIDSASHEHEGTGGVLEMHEEEVQRLAKKWKAGRDAAQLAAWATPKQAHRAFVQGALRLPLHLIWCFRAKPKLKIRKGEDPQNLGFMPIAADDLVYEMLMTALLMPGAQGHPTWQSNELGEKQMIKLPHWARALLRSGHPLDEELGAALARWAKGDAPRPARAESVGRPAGTATLEERYARCPTMPAFEALEGERRTVWGRLSSGHRAELKAAADAARARLSQAEIEELAARDECPPDDVELPTFEEQA